MKVYNNMAYGLRMRNLNKSEIKERVNKVAETLALTHVLNRTPRQLSGGQRQRVAMGRAMVREPAIFLFDEPLSNLDANLRVQMRLEIKQLQKQTQVTSIYVTHDQVEAMTLADRLIVMDHGVVEQIGTPLEIYQKPATRFVAGFMGSPAMNFIIGKVLNDNTIHLTSGTSLQYQNPNLTKLIGKNIFVGIRPECFALDSSASNANSIELVVEQIESLGSDTLLHGIIHKSDQRVIARVHGYWQDNIDQRIKFSVEPQHLHFFEMEKGIRL
jgi:sn-glycerol 3-phosphate transport system ATP-binding protein